MYESRGADLSTGNVSQIHILAEVDFALALEATPVDFTILVKNPLWVTKFPYLLRKSELRGESGFQVDFPVKTTFASEVLRLVRPYTHEPWEEPWEGAGGTGHSPQNA